MNVGFTALKVVVQVVSEQVDQVYCVVSRVSLELIKFEFTQRNLSFLGVCLKWEHQSTLVCLGKRTKVI